MESQQYNYQSLQEHLYNLVQGIVQNLNISFPQDPFQYSFISKAVKKMFPEWNPKKSGTQHQKWNALIKYLQLVIGETIELKNKNYLNQQDILVVLSLINDLSARHYQPQKINQKPKKKQRPLTANVSKSKVNYPTKLNQNSNFEQQVIKTIKQSLSKKINFKDPKISNLMRDKKSTEAVSKAKRIFQYQLKNYKKTLNNQKQKPQVRKEQMQSKYLKYIQKKHKNIQQNIVSQQLKYYLALRDKKLNYIKNIHNLLAKLELERQRDLHKQQTEIYHQQKNKIKDQIQATENIFQSNIQHLKEKYQQKKQLKQFQQADSLKMCRQIEKQVTKKKNQQINEIKILWEQQCLKLQGITGIQKKIQQKILKIYRENRV